MTVVAPDSSAAGPTAALVMGSDSMVLLCPFFDKCDGVLLHAADGAQTYHPRDRSGAKSVCDLILELKPAKVICGFIDEPEKQRLRAAGIDVRLGSCSCPIDELILSFPRLPIA